jgi:NAD dependent epimerase/dehydratase family enzyme
VVLSSGIPAAVIRAGGLCGQDRHPGIWSRSASVLAGNEPVNMIWKEDLIELILHIVSKRLSGIYNAVAPVHPIREDFYKHCFANMNTPLPEFSSGASKTNRIVLSEKIRNTGFEFGFPDPCKFPV